MNRRTLYVLGCAFAALGIVSALLSATNFVWAIVSPLASVAAIFCVAVLLFINRGRSYVAEKSLSNWLKWAFSVFVLVFGGYNVTTIGDGRAWHRIATDINIALVAVLMLAQQNLRGETSSGSDVSPPARRS